MGSGSTICILLSKSIKFLIISSFTDFKCGSRG